MSIKQNIFELSLHSFGPANVYSFLVILGGAINTAVLVEASEVPGIQTSQLQVPLPGTSVMVPGTMQLGGTFNCTVVETQTFMVNWELLRSITVTENPYRGGNRQNAAFSSPSGVFDSFIFSLQSGMTATFIMKLQSCFITSRGPVQMSAADATRPWKWPISICYGRLVNEIYATHQPLVLDALLLGEIGLMKGLNKLV